MGLVLILDLPSIIGLIIAELHHTTTLSQGQSHHPEILPTGSLTPYLMTYYLASPSLRISSNTYIGLCVTQLLWSAHLIDVCLLSEYNHQCLSFVGGLKSDTSSIVLSDISHHHLSIS